MTMPAGRISAFHLVGRRRERDLFDLDFLFCFHRLNFNEGKMIIIFNLSNEYTRGKRNFPGYNKSMLNHANDTGRSIEAF
jgi:hypothetical protein